jgi:hypothetical protein
VSRLQHGRFEFKQKYESFDRELKSRKDRWGKLPKYDWEGTIEEARLGRNAQQRTTRKEGLGRNDQEPELTSHKSRKRLGKEKAKLIMRELFSVHSFHHCITKLFQMISLVAIEVQRPRCASRVMECAVHNHLKGFERD